MPGESPAASEFSLQVWSMSSPTSHDYAGDIDAAEAWTMLEANPKAQLVDVRTVAEWNFVGLPDLSKDPVARVIHRGFVWWALTGLVLPGILGGLITQTWMGAFTGFLWGGLARVFMGHHATWSVNSICHLWGTQPFKTRDESRNNAAVAVVSLGEGWHNNHHAHPQSARHGLRWYQMDLTWILIRILNIFGLASNVQVAH